MSSQDTQSTTEDAQLRAGIDRSLRHPVMFFLCSGAAWLAVSILLGVIASAKMHHPEFLSSCPLLSYGRVFPAHMNVLIYGWAMQAAFAVIIWLMARLSRKECRSAGTILTAGHIWNLGVTMGTLGILGGYGTGIQWMEFPVFAWPVLLISYFIIIIWSFIQFRVRPKGQVYVTQWYLLAAMVWFPWIYITANTLIHCLEGHPVMAAGINAWFRSGMLLLFFTPVALGAAYYLAPKVTGRPVFSYALAKLGFWSLAIIAPWAGMQKLAGAPIPAFLPYVGAAATALIFIPACTAAVNMLCTVLSDKDTLSKSPSLRFVTAGITGLIILACSAVLLNLPFDGFNTLQLSQFSISGYGFDVLGIYGFFSLVMFGATYFIVPRITRREWVSKRLISMHFLLSCYGVVFVALVAIFGGLMQGLGIEDWKTNDLARANPYAWAVTISWSLILLSNVFFLLHLALMWMRLGRRSTHPTLLVSSHDHASPHGEEGDIDNAGEIEPAH
ncbi:MAG: cbb3-type cytochrome c oxidase subunit I [Luteolibacter sp.]